MNEITVTLGGRQFTLPKLTIRAEAEWRRQTKEVMAPLLGVSELAQMELATVADMAKAVQAFGEWLDPLDALNVLIAYAPGVLEGQREWLEEHAYSDEVIGVLLRLFFTGPEARASRRNGVAPQLAPTM